MSSSHSQRHPAPTRLARRPLMAATLLVLAMLAALTSCIREELPPCPPLRVTIDVLDKNYFNVNQVDLEERLADDLPLRSYVPTLWWRLSRLDADGTLTPAAERGVFAVEGEEPTHDITFSDDLPHGTYVFTVWGGLSDLSALSADRRTLTFHPGESEGADVYMTCDTLVYDATHHTHTALLRRTKGKLIVQVEQLPADICRSCEYIDGLFGTLDCEPIAYSGRTRVTDRNAWAPGTSPVVTKTVLAPSVGQRQSTLSMHFHNDPTRGEPMLAPEDVAITLRRNELTVLRYVWEGGDGWAIYILVNDGWERVHGMEID